MVLGFRLRGEIRPGAMPALHHYVDNPLTLRSCARADMMPPALLSQKNEMMKKMKNAR